MKSVRIGSAEVRYTPDGCYTQYDDGKAYASHPHATPHYAVIAHRCGYGDDILAYCREHEVCHLIAGEWLIGGGSWVLRPLAEGKKPSQTAALLEETLVQAFQRWLRANERPIVGNVDWDGLKARALALLDD